MARKFKITEEQYNSALDEGITLKADLEAAGGDANKAIETTKQEARDNGVDIEKATIEVPANESKIITKKKLMENRINFIKNNSNLYSYNEFIKKINN